MLNIVLNKQAYLIMGTWNYRVMVHDAGKKSRYFAIHTVYYDSDNSVNSCSSDPSSLIECSIDDLECDLRNKLLAFDRPVLYYGDKFPNEYIYGEEGV